MRLPSLLAVALSSAATVVWGRELRAACCNDACLGAARLHQSAGCSSFFQVTVTPRPVVSYISTATTLTTTATVTHTTTVGVSATSTSTLLSSVTGHATVTSIVSVTSDETVTQDTSIFETAVETVADVITETTTVSGTPIITARNVGQVDCETSSTHRASCPTTTAAPSTVPWYASACHNAQAYSSACACLGVKHTTHTQAPCTTVSTRTMTVTAAATHTVTRTATATATTPFVQTVTSVTTISVATSVVAQSSIVATEDISAFSTVIDSVTVTTAVASTKFVTVTAAASSSATSSSSTGCPPPPTQFYLNTLNTLGTTDNNVPLAVVVGSLAPAIAADSFYPPTQFILQAGGILMDLNSEQVAGVQSTSNSAIGTTVLFATLPESVENELLNLDCSAVLVNRHTCQYNLACEEPATGFHEFGICPVTGLFIGNDINKACVAANFSMVTTAPRSVPTASFFLHLAQSSAAANQTDYNNDPLLVDYSGGNSTLYVSESGATTWQIASNGFVTDTSTGNVLCVDGNPNPDGSTSVQALASTSDSCSPLSCETHEFFDSSSSYFQLQCNIPAGQQFVYPANGPLALAPTRGATGSASLGTPVTLNCVDTQLAAM